ncbi:MAG TPA: 5'-nucleotidase, lipoprotein e(P4) family [Chitinophagaceae bacterium]
MKNLSLVILVLAAACTSTRQPASPPRNSIIVDGKIFTTVFQQRAAEYRALCYQAYNIAYLRLDMALASPHDKPLAIITDIDETVLDNSIYAARQALQGKDYESASWAAYTAEASADTVPGAFHFLRYASSQGVQIFYVTNRAANEKDGTLKNLIRFNFPDADEKHLLLKQESSGKEPRRHQVMEQFDVPLLLGDNLSDFSFIFDKQPVAERNAATNSVAAEFGNRFIMLPNPVYGDWESALFEYRYSLTPERKDSVLKSWLKTR